LCELIDPSFPSAAISKRVKSRSEIIAVRVQAHVESDLSHPLIVTKQRGKARDFEPVDSKTRTVESVLENGRGIRRVEGRSDLSML